jgi:hypothetical protein
MADKGTTSGKVIALHPLKAKKTSERKWGKEVMALGFCIVPSLLLRAQARLKLDPTHLAILIHLADFWWEAERKPHPSKKTLGERLSLSARQVQRKIAELEAMKLLQRVERTAASRGKRSNFHDLSGLVARLKELEREFRQVEEKAKAERRRVARPGFRHRTGTAVD